MAKNLEEILVEINTEEEVEQQEQFLVTDLETAAEAQRRITYFNEQITSIDNIIQKQIEPFLKKIEKIKAWGNEAKNEHVDKIDYYSKLLEFYMREEISKQVANGKKPKKTVKLPYGKIALKSQQPEFEKDEELLLSFAKQVGHIKTKESTEWAELKKQCEIVEGKLVYKETGEIVPGVTVTERDDKFSLTLEV